jgi:hypothetical protein
MTRAKLSHVCNGRFVMPERGIHRVAVFATASLFAVLLAGSPASAQSAAPANACPSTNTGITLPTGFCATVFADNLGHAIV